jgi:hypothetical protein
MILRAPMRTDFILPALRRAYTVDLPTPPEPPPINEEEAYRKNLTRWLDGDDAQKGDARQFFWHAFAGSQVVETIEEVECFGTGQHMSRPLVCRTDG